METIHLLLLKSIFKKQENSTTNQIMSNFLILLDKFIFYPNFMFYLLLILIFYFILIYILFIYFLSYIF